MLLPGLDASAKGRQPKSGHPALAHGPCRTPHSRPMVRRCGQWHTLIRPAFDRMQQGIFLGTITTVVVWKLGRISRCQREGINLLAEWCERGVRVVVIT